MDPQTNNYNQTGNENQPNSVVSASNAESIQYEDGSIQKKQYGGAGEGALTQIFVHLIQKTKEQVETQIVNTELKLSLADVSVLLSEKTKIALNNPQFRIKLDESPLNQQTTLQKLVPSDNKNNLELYLFYDQTKAIIKQKISEIFYQPISKYSFIDDKNKVKVYIQLEGIGAVPSENIISRFLEWSLEIKIHDYRGKNWKFAVPKTQCILRPRDSKVIQKQNRLIISIAKNAEADNWFSLYKVKCVGQRDD